MLPLLKKGNLKLLRGINKLNLLSDRFKSKAMCRRGMWRSAYPGEVFLRVLDDLAARGDGGQQRPLRLRQQRRHLVLLHLRCLHTHT